MRDTRGFFGALGFFTTHRSALRASAEVHCDVMSNDRRPKQQTVRVGELASNTERVTKLASRPGGVRVVDDNGVERFRLSIPSAQLTE